MPFYSMPDGEQLFVREYGQGQPVLVLSGLGMLSWQWSAFLYPHQQKFRFIIPEWRGFGASSECKIPQDLNAIESHWSDLESLLQQLELNKPIVLAYSMGATTAMHGLKYGQFKDQILAYLHIDQTPKITVDQDWAYGLFGEQHTTFKNILSDISELLAQYPHAKVLKDLPAHARAKLATDWMAFIQLQNSNPYSLKALKFVLHQSALQNMLLPSNRLDYLAWYINNYLNHDEDYRQALGHLHCPVTFFSGAQSKLYPIEGQTQIAQSLPHAEQILFHKSGHTPLISEPIKFAREIARFLKQTSASYLSA